MQVLGWLVQRCGRCELLLGTNEGGSLRHRSFELSIESSSPSSTDFHSADLAFEMAEHESYQCTGQTV